MKCVNVDGNCGMNNVVDYRCCFYCGFKGTCKGLCINLESEGDCEEVAKKCSDFVEG